MKMKKVAAAAVSTALLSGCATHQWAPGPNARGTFEEAKGRCTLQANHSGGGFVAAGTPRFVAGASVGAAVGQAVAAQNDFNACMSADGWVTDDPKPSEKRPNQEQAKAILLEAKAVSLSCISAARSQPKYQRIIGHLGDPAVGRYTFTQMANQDFPTAEESALGANYQDDVQPCRQALVDRICSLSAAAGLKVKAQVDASIALVVLLIQRKISWGDYATRVQAIADASSAPKT